jgi:hypothetical protein
VNIDKKKERLAALLGIELPKDPTFEDDEASREAEAVVAFYETPKLFTERMCKHCERVFAVNRACVAYCSDTCRKKALLDIGIEWDATRPPEERWENKMPLTVPPSALELVRPLIPEDTEQQSAG